jgi:hypothetical protein
VSADAARWRPIARANATAAGVDADLFDALLQVESGYDPDLVSAKGAVGIAQIVPRWHPDVDARDPEASLTYASRLLASHLREFGSERLALAAYNAGQGAVHSVGNQVPDNGETPAYVDKVLAVVSRLRASTSPSESATPEAPKPTAVAAIVAGVNKLNSPDPTERRAAAFTLTALALGAVILFGD